jgi:hypothetical protein
MSSFEDKIDALGQRLASLSRMLADLKVQRSELAPSVVDGDQQARAELQKVDVAHTHAEKESGLIRDAVEQLKVLAAQHKANVAAKERQNLEAAAQKLGEAILKLDAEIDGMLGRMRECFEQRRATATELGKLRVADPHLVMRLHQRYGPTAALVFNNLNTFCGVEHIEPHHRRSLSDSDAWLRRLGANKQQCNSHDKQTERKEASNGS